MALSIQERITRLERVMRTILSTISSDALDARAINKLWDEMCSEYGFGKEVDTVDW